MPAGDHSLCVCECCQAPPITSPENIHTEVDQRLRTLEQLLFVPFDWPFVALHEDAQLPEKSGELEACWDMRCVADERFLSPDCILGMQHRVEKPFIELRSGHSHVFHTGLSCAIPEGRAAYLWDRSGMGAKQKIHRLAGVIDCTYRGEWMVCLTNLGFDSQIIQAGDKIIQVQLALVLPAEPRWSTALPKSYRGTAGFGSSGR